jgi:hypothetical protein
VKDFAQAFFKALRGAKSVVLGKGEGSSMNLELILEEGSGNLPLR